MWSEEGIPVLPIHVAVCGSWWLGVTWFHPCIFRMNILLENFTGFFFMREGGIFMDVNMSYSKWMLKMVQNYGVECVQTYNFTNVWHVNILNELKFLLVKSITGLCCIQHLATGFALNLPSGKSILQAKACKLTQWSAVRYM